MARGQKPLQFRPFRTTDSTLLGAWLSACGLGVPRGVDDHTWARRVIQDPNILCWAATLAGRTVGFVRLDIGPDRTAELTMIVHPDRRRVGLGMALLDQALCWARERGLCRLLAVVESANEVAQCFFQHAGFEATGASNGHVHLSRLVHRADEQPPLEISP
ncbi:MAG: GNAT family N-acetyltransferase [Planctomycetota bacterium]|jgi:ribosomal protein S18 acetylase RimI-like enzyme